MIQVIWELSLKNMYSKNQIYNKLLMYRFSMYHHVKYNVFILEMFSNAYWICHFVVAEFLSYHHYHTHFKLIAMVPDAF